MARPTATTISREIIAYLKQHDAYDLLPQVAAELAEEASRNQSISVISATELPASDRKELTAMLTKKWGEHPLVFTVDPVILAGFIVKFQDKIIDLSGKGRLKDLAQQLK